MLLKWVVFFFSSYFVLLYTFLVLFFIPRFVCALVFRTVLVSCLSFFLVVSDALRFTHNILFFCFVCLSFFFFFTLADPAIEKRFQDVDLLPVCLRRMQLGEALRALFLSLSFFF